MKTLFVVAFIILAIVSVVLLTLCWTNKSWSNIPWSVMALFSAIVAILFWNNGATLTNLCVALIAIILIIADTLITLYTFPDAK